MFTEGEWYITKHGITYEVFAKPDAKKLAYLVAGDIYNKNNAHLIAAAPDLYEACKKGLELLDINLEHNRGKVSELLKRATEKAEGK